MFHSAADFLGFDAFAVSAFEPTENFYQHIHPAQGLLGCSSDEPVSHSAA